MEEQPVIYSLGFIKCPECDELHRVLPGTTAPEYFCPTVGRTLELKVGDQVLTLTPKTPSDLREERNKKLRAVFGLVALVVGIVAAIFAYRWMPSYTLAFFALVMVVHVVARGIPDVITDPQKVQRILFFALYPAICSGVLYFTYQRWNRMWLAVLLGLIVGGILNTIAGATLFPQVFKEEEEDNRRRMEEARRK